MVAPGNSKILGRVCKFKGGLGCFRAAFIVREVFWGEEADEIRSMDSVAFLPVPLVLVGRKYALVGSDIPFKKLWLCWEALK